MAKNNSVPIGITRNWDDWIIKVKLPGSKWFQAIVRGQFPDHRAWRGRVLRRHCKTRSGAVQYREDVRQRYYALKAHASLPVNQEGLAAVLEGMERLGLAEG